MQVLLRINGQTVTIDMDRAQERVLRVGEFTYRLPHVAQRLRKLTGRMWGRDCPPELLDQRLVFEAINDIQPGGWGDSGSFTPSTGSSVVLGRWDENATIGIALHELAHEMHMRQGGYDYSDGTLREALALLAERESGLKRTFDREPYYTASNLIGQLAELGTFTRLPFAQRWTEVTALTTASGISDLINFYIDRDEGLGLINWLKRLSGRVEERDKLMNLLALCSLRYSLTYRRILIGTLVKSDPTTPFAQIQQVIEAIMTLDRRYPDDDLNKIIKFCFAPVARTRRGLLAFG